MNKLQSGTLLAISLALSAPALCAQSEESELTVGDRVRITVPTRDFAKTTGTIDSINSKRMVLRMRPPWSRELIVVHIPLDSIQHIERRDPDAGRRTAKASVLGGAIAFVGVGVVGALMTRHEYIPYVGAIWAGPAAVPGALIGGIAGHFSARSWQDVAIPIRVRSNALPAPIRRARSDVLSFSIAPVVRDGGQFGLSAALRF
ncbi:MAG: hypothetical protein ACO1Q7_16795 [Gemmatimonas sp.]